MYLQFGGTKVHYEVTGDGPAVLLLHAFPLHAGMWNAQVKALSTNYKVIVPDMPGFGKSPPASTPVTMDLYAQVALAVLDAAGVQRAAVAGLSMGGYIAFALHARAPERVAALVLADTRATPDTADGKHAREQTARAVEDEGIEILVERQLPNLLSHGASAANRRDVERLIVRNPAAGAAAALRGMAQRHDFTAHLPKITCPTLVVVGHDDTLTPPADSQAMASAISGAEFVSVPGAGHLSSIEKPEAFTRAVKDFLDRALPRDEAK